MRRAPRLLIALTLACAGIALAWQQPQPAPRAAPPTASPAASPNAYVDPALCARCHAAIARTYALTGMGRSFRPVTAATLGLKLPSRPYFHAPSQTYYTLVARGGQIFERQWQTGFDGKPANLSELRVDDVLGSGNHAIAFLHLTPQNTLVELPFGWYATRGPGWGSRGPQSGRASSGSRGEAARGPAPVNENGGTWAMQPGYDRPDHAGATRQIGYECMFCHNAYPANAATAREGAEPVYQLPLPHGIDCQRCHGPGLRHIEAATGGARAQQIRAAIVNPARLGPTGETEVCMQCHLETTSLKLPHSLLRAGRRPFSYIPGQPLADYRLAFDRAPGRNTRFEIDSSAYRLRQSQCFIQTQSWAPSKRLQCTTCHDPHNIPHGAAANQHYNAVCESCHATRSAGLGQAGPQAGASTSGTRGVAAQGPAPINDPAHPAATDCISCHMPQRRTADGIHMVMTDHLIQRRPPANPLAPKAEYVETAANAYKGPVDLYYPTALPTTPENQLDLAVAQVQDDSNLEAGIRQLTALIRQYKPAPAAYYTDLAVALHDAGDQARSTAMFQQALAHAPNSASIRLRFAQAQIDWRQWTAATTNLERLTRLTPTDPAAWGLLGEAEFQQGRDPAATQALTRAVTLDPESASSYNYLGLLHARGGDNAGAETDFRKALAIAPNVAPAQANLASLLASEGKLPEARFLFQRALRLDPNLVSARINYGRLLANQGDTVGALTQARAAIRIDARADPQSPDAHEFLGYLLALQGNGAAAVPELTAAVRLDPKFWRAHLELGVALSLTGHTAAARREWESAAHGTDLAVAATALQMLQSQP